MGWLGLGRFRYGPHTGQLFVQTIRHIAEPTEAGSTPAENVDYLGLVLGLDQFLVEQVAK